MSGVEDCVEFKAFCVQQKYELDIEKRRAKWQKLFSRNPGLSYLRSKDFKKMVRNGLVNGTGR